MKQMLPMKWMTLLIGAGLMLSSCGPANVAGGPNTAPSASPQQTSATAAPTTPAQTLAPATAAPTAQVPAPTAEPVSEPTATAEPVAPTAQPSPQPTSVPTTSQAQELLFLRQGTLVALNMVSKSERTIADNVRDFSPNVGGTLIALVRGSGVQTEIWTVQRDGSNLMQRTSDNRAEATISWAPDGSAFVYASAATDTPYTRMWTEWGRWCAASEVRLLDLAAGTNQSLGAGCDPAFGSDSKRVAFASPPTRAQGDTPSTLANTIRLVNRQGQNGWNFATADGGFSGDDAKGGLLVYAPSWSPDASQIVYHRFLGYQALVDLGISQIAPSFKGGGQPLLSGGGWQLPAGFSPDGRHVVITQHNYGDARGFGGYDNWSTTIIRLEGQRDIAMPTGSMAAVGQEAGRLPRAQQAAWSPDGQRLAVELPPNWQPNLPDNQQFNEGKETPGDLWLWQPGAAPSERIVSNVDFASPLAWLP